MFIRNLKLKDFCNVPFQEFKDLPDSIALFGFNGHGKTTILYAIQMLLFGFCDRTTKGGAGSAALIRDGAKKAEISADLEVGGADRIRVFLTLNQRGANEWGCCYESGECIEGADDRKGLWKALSIDMEHAKVAAFSAQMLRSKELSDPLADFLSSEIDLDRLTDLCGAHYPWFLRFCALRQMSPVHDALTNPNSKVQLEAKHLEEIGQHAFDIRTGRKKERAAAKDQVENAGHIAPPVNGKGEALTVEQIPALEGQHARWQAQVDALHVQLGAAQNAPDADAVAAQQAEADAALAEAQHAEAVALQEHEQFDAEYKASKAEVADAEQTLTQAKHTQVRLGGDIETLKRELATLEAPGAACAMCGQAMKAAVKKEVIAPRKERLESLERELKARADMHAAVLETLTAARDVEKQVRDKSERAVLALHNAGVAVARTQAVLDAVPVPYDGPGIETIEADIAKLRDQMTRCAEAIDTLKRIKVVEENTAYIAHADAEIEELDWCVQAFQKGEVLNQLLGDPVKAFEERCNAELAPMGYALSVETAGKTLTPLLHCPGSPTPRPVANCSAGQQVLAAVAIASAFSCTGVPVLLDDLNHLDPVNRGKVLTRMRQKASGSVVCCTTCQQKPDEVERAAGLLAPVAAYWVEGGRYRAVGATAQASTAAVAGKEAA